MENESPIPQRDPLRKSIEAWERRRRLRYILVPVGLLLLIVGLTLRHTVPGKVMAVFGAVFVGMYRYNGSRSSASSTMSSLQNRLSRLAYSAAASA